MGRSQRRDKWRRWRAASQRDSDAVAIGTALVPALLAIVPLTAVAVTVVRLVQLGHPLPGFIGGATNSDALQLYHGQGLYHDPATGYAGSIYSPGTAAVVSVLDRLVLWSGWVLLLGYTASIPVGALAGRLAYRGGYGGWRRRSELAAAAGFGAFGWCFITALQNPSLYEGRVDHLAWLLAFAGLLLVPRAGSGSRRALIACVVLFTAAIWVKQSAVAAPIAALVWLLTVTRSPARTRTALALGGALLAVNALLATVAVIWSHGWAYRWLIELGLRQPVLFGRGHIVGEFLGDHAVLLACLAVLVFAAVMLSPSPPSRWWERSLPSHVSLLGIFIVVAAIVAYSARRKQGGEDNDYIPVTWALVLLAGAAFGAARAHLRGQVAGAAVIIAVVVASQWTWFAHGLDRRGIRLPTFHPTGTWLSGAANVTPATWPFARSRSFYDWTGTIWSHDDVDRGYPPMISFLNALSDGRSPRYLTNAFLDRRFAALSPFPDVFETGPIERYASAQGRYEDGFIWKLNRVIASRYQRVAGVPPGVLVRRPGPEPARWMRRCFGPFQLGALSLSIRHGGGFWCAGAPGSDVLELVRTPARTSEVVTTGDAPVSLTGTLRLALAAGRAQLVFSPRSGGPVTVLVRRAAARRSLLVQVRTEAGLHQGIVTASLTAGGRRLLAIDLAPSGPVVIGRSDVTVPAGGGQPTDLRVTASANSRLRLDATALGRGSEQVRTPP
jgi:hypothetical protein